MPGGTYLDIDETSGQYQRKQAISSSAGASDANKVVMSNASGKVDGTLIDISSGLGGDTITCTENLSAGDIVSEYQVGGARRVRKALAADYTKPATHYVLIAASNGTGAVVYSRGKNTFVGLTGFTTADIGKRVFLSASTSGGVTKTPPVAAGNLLQHIGYISDVTSSYVEIEFSSAAGVEM